MKKFLVLILLCCLYPTPAFSADDCLLDPASLKPAMSDKGTVLYKVEKKSSERELIETAILSNGTKITHAAGGCAHYGFTYTFENIPDSILKEQNPYDLAIALLLLVPWLEDDKNDEQSFIDTFRIAKSNGIKPHEDGGFACGDAWCSISREHGLITLSYSFPL